MDADIQAAFADSLERFNRERYDPTQWSAYGRLPDARAPAIWAEMREMGWFDLARSWDGAQVAPLTPVLPLFKAAGEGLWREPLGPVFGEAPAILAAMDDLPRRESLLEAVCAGQDSIGVAVSPAAATGDARHRVTAHPAGGPVPVLSGRCAGVVADAGCRAYWVSAVSHEARSVAVYRVEAGAIGLEVRPYRTLDDRAAADLWFHATPAERLCGGEQPMLEARARSAVLAAAESVGIMNGAVRDTVEYLRQRRQFGQPLIRFQALQHRLVEMLMQQRETEALLQQTAEAFDEAMPDRLRQGLALRAQASAALRHITREAVQLHGGMGVTQELRIGRYYRRALVLDSLHGSADMALEALALP